MNTLVLVAFAIAAFWALGLYTRWWCVRARRIALLNLHRELGTLKWVGSDDGWYLAIKAVREHISRTSTRHRTEK